MRLRTAIVLTCGLLSLPAAAVALAFSGLLFVAIDNAAAATAAGSTSPYVVTSAQRGDPSAIRHEVACIPAQIRRDRAEKLHAHPEVRRQREVRKVASLSPGRILEGGRRDMHRAGVSLRGCAAMSGAPQEIQAQ